MVVELKHSDEHLLEESAASESIRKLFQLKKILVPIDFSDCSRKALMYAFPLARQFGASLTLLHVVYANYAYGEYAGCDFKQLESQLLENGRKDLAEFAKREVAGPVSCATDVRAGRAADEIVLAAREDGVDLVIISTHGRTGLAHVFLGSTAEEVVRRAPCPVLTVREREHEFIR